MIVTGVIVTGMVMILSLLGLGDLLHCLFDSLLNLFHSGDQDRTAIVVATLLTCAVRQKDRLTLRAGSGGLGLEGVVRASATHL